MSETDLPDFIKKYMNGIEDANHHKFTTLAKEYNDELYRYKTEVYPVQQKNMDMMNKLTGEKKRVNYEHGMEYVRIKYENQAMQLAEKTRREQQQERRRELEAKQSKAQQKTQHDNPDVAARKNAFAEKFNNPNGKEKEKDKRKGDDLAL